ncbi:ROK family transcriptional regulator [Prescottella agglutinans]|uniref:NBD/HSP70 family sugar kinase n=1 Tax=Prescottella agglutinans TaxID=1644129 RepID=A0ABT6MHU9_9NOCA|nr:ROK family transcriptional regulator [Prescottella agglutinans]MDH6283890.1 putative NBD/HSP70 family sugar kinase [Prescottella agglutinans]
MSAPRRPFAAPTTGDILALVRGRDAATRAGIAALTGLSRTAVSARVEALQKLNLIVEVEDGVSTGGRPPATLRFNTDAGVVLAAALGRSRTEFAVCNLAGDVLASEDIEHEIGMGPDTLMPRVADHLAALLTRVGRPASDVIGTGLSIPGSVDVERGCSLDTPMMPGWDGIELAPYLADVSDAPVLVDNDANAMALAEWHGGRQDYASMLLIKTSTGLGAGIIADGLLQRGVCGAAGEIGHTKSPAAAGLVCRCGEIGCVEAVAGGWALVEAMQKRGRDVGHVRDVVALSHAGDAEARRLIRGAGRHIGEVLAGAVNLLNPEVLVVSGDTARAYEPLLAGLRETLYGNAVAVATKRLQIQPSIHGTRSGLIGCATLALEQLLSPRAIDDALASKETKPSR